MPQVSCGARWRHDQSPPDRREHISRCSIHVVHRTPENFAPEAGARGRPEIAKSSNFASTFTDLPRSRETTRNGSESTCEIRYRIGCQVTASSLNASVRRVTRATPILVDAHGRIKRSLIFLIALLRNRCEMFPFGGIRDKMFLKKFFGICLYKMNILKLYDINCYLYLPVQRYILPLKYALYLRIRILVIQIF